MCAREPLGAQEKMYHDETFLGELGIDRNHSHRWQLLARMDEAEFLTHASAHVGARERRQPKNYARTVSYAN